jgi:hypothetical protein
VAAISRTREAGKAEAAALVAKIRQHRPPRPFDSKRFQLFEHLLAYLNAAANGR